VLVILVMLILIIIVTGFTAFTTQDVKTADVSMDAATCYYLAEAGIDYGVYLIKHNLSIYPSAGYAGGIGQNSAYTKAGAVMNLSYDYETNVNDLDVVRQEHIVISNLAYPQMNWMSVTSLCGTFAVKYDLAKCTFTPASGPATVVLQSTGYIRQMPSSLASSTNLLGVSITNRNWPIKAQRTVSMKLRIATTSASISSSARPYMTVEKFFEKFR